MAVINKQFIHFAKKATLLKHIDAKEILPTSIVFVKETGEIYVNGKYYTNYNQTEANTTAISLILELSGWWIEESGTTIWYFDDGSTYEEDVVGELDAAKAHNTNGQMPLYSHIVKIEIGDNVTSIGVSAFNGCSNLTSITIPNSVNSIGSTAFLNCTSLTSLTIPNSVIIINSGAFSGCSSLVSMTIPDSVIIIDSGAFSGCSSLVSITIPDSVTSIYDRVFYRCVSLTSVIYKGVEYTSKSALENTLVENDITLGDYVFDNTALTD